MKYKKGYKIQITDFNTYQTRLRPLTDVSTRFISLDTNGVLIIRPGYPSDGCSGPTFDTPKVIPG